MIKSIVIENFFSFGEKMSLQINKGVNILVGINGSGKSNFLKAIRLLHEGVVGKDGFEKLFLGDWGGFNSVGNFTQGQSDFVKIIYEFDKAALQNATDNKGYIFRTNPFYEIVIYRSASTGYYLSEKVYSKDPNKPSRKPFTFMEMENGQGVISTRDDAGKIGLQRYPENTDQISFKPQELILRQISDPTSFYPLFSLKSALERMLVYDYFDTTLKSPIRDLSAYSVEKQLLPDGRNLVQILQRMKNHHSLSYEKVEELLENINPNFKDISFDFIGAKSLLVLREKSLAKSVSVEHISDGTLRFLLLLSILYNPERGHLICIDEPEIGLHPDMINTIAQAIKFASNKGSQILIATHSPILLNSFELDDIWIFEKDRNNQTKISSKEEDDFKDWNSNFLTGQMWLAGKLGGTRWQ